MHNIEFPGLKHALLLDGHGGASELTWQAAQQWQPEQGILWLHFDYSASETQNWFKEHSGLDPLVCEALLSEDTRPRSHSMQDGLLISLRGINHNPGAAPDDMVSIRIWIEHNRIITTGRRKLLSVEDLHNFLLKHQGVSSAAEWLVDLCDRLVWRMGATVDQFEDDMAELEENTLNETQSALRRDLSNLRRQTIALRRYLAPQREALLRLQIEKVSWLEDIHRLQLREISDRLIRHIEDIDAVRERAAVTHEELLSHASEELNQRMYMLAIVAAIFLPLGFVTGLLGINVAGIPGAENPYAFLVVSGTLSLAVIIQIAYFKWKSWL
jgi:zinc transporter